MLNVYELERQWFRYKIRYYLPLGIALFSIILVTILGWLFWPTQSVERGQMSSNTVVQQPAATPMLPITNTIPPQQATALPESVAVAKPVQQQPAIGNEQHSVPSSTTIVMEPSLGFIQTLQEEEVDPIVESTPVRSERVPENLAKVDTEAVVTTPEPVVTQQPVPVQVQKQESTISITQQDANDLHDVVKRFASNKNPALSLFLARRYYDMGEYQHAYDYALKTNELDNEIEASWLIFAKSLVKLDKKEQAIKVLTSYINHSKSLRAKNLLEEIRTGQFQ